MNICFYYNTAKHKSNKTQLLSDFAASFSPFKKYKTYFIHNINEKTILPNTKLIIVWAFFPNNKNPAKKFYKKNINNFIWLFIDSDPLISYNTPDLFTNYYFRLPLKSVFFNYDHENYFFNQNNNKWPDICQKKNITIKPWININQNNTNQNNTNQNNTNQNNINQNNTNQDKYILILLQNPNGFGIGSFNMYDWLNNTISNIRKYTNRKIVLRSKPNTITEYFNNQPNISFSNPNNTLFDDLSNASVTVSINTTAAIVGIIEGIPSFCDNKESMIYDISNHDIKDIETPIYTDREIFFKKYSNICWNYEEIKNGTVSKYLISYLNK